MSTNPLDDLFQSSGESSDSADDTPETTADMILRAASSGMVSDRWISDKNRHFFYDSKARRLICHTEGGKYLEYRGEGRYVPMEDPTVRSSINEQIQEPAATECAEKKEKLICWITTVPSDCLDVFTDDLRSAKRQKVSDQDAGAPKLSFQELIESAKIPDLKSFLEKWDLLTEEPTVRHFLKLDKQLVQYIIRRFNPIKAKPKNALLKFEESLLKHPQKWRIFGAIEEGLLDSGSCETVPVNDFLRIKGPSDQSEDETGCTELEQECCNLCVRQVDSDFFLFNLDPELPVQLDGMRILPIDGPVGPLMDGSVIAIPRPGRMHNLPGTLLLVELGSVETLLKRRN